MVFKIVWFSKLYAFRNCMAYKRFSKEFCHFRGCIKISKLKNYYPFSDPTTALAIKLDESVWQPIDMAYDTETTLNVLQTTMNGDLVEAESVQFRYTDRDVLCLEMLILESMDKSVVYDIIEVFKSKQIDAFNQ